MSHRACPKCGSSEHYYGYGLAAGPIGTYLMCLGCGHMFDDEFIPDEQAKVIDD